MRRFCLLVILLFAAGCAGSREAPAADDRAGRLLVGLGVEGGSGPAQTTFAVGQPVTLVLFVENRGREPARVTYTSGQRYDFVVSRDGQEVWRWSAAAGMAFTQAVVEVEVAPGERLVHREVWRGMDATGRPVAPGTYDVRGIVPLTPRPLETPPLAIALEGP